MKSYRVVFFGTPDIAVPCLTQLITHDQFTVTAVVTQPDRPVGRKKIITPPPIKVIAEQHRLPVFQPEHVSDLELNEQPDYLVTMAYGQKIPSKLLDLANIAPVNVHVSLLPRWRGASPIQHAILAGDRETGVTIQTMSDTIDAGEILSQETIEIDARETSESLSNKLSKLGAQLLIETLTQPITPVKQNEVDVTNCKKLSREDGALNAAHLTAVEFDRYVRALWPWPGVTCEVDGTLLKIIETSLSETEESISLACKDDTTVHLVAVQPPGKTPMSGASWNRGR